MRRLIVPTGLFACIFLGFYACGSGDDNKDTSTAEPVSWNKASSILNDTCAGDGAGCHNQMTANGELNFQTITEEEFLASDSLARIQNEQDPMPPPAGSDENPDGIVLSESDRLALVKFLSQ